MRGLYGLAAFAATVLAHTEVMVPLYVYPGNASWTNPNWSAAVDAFKANPHLHFYVVINPNNGPKNTSDPTGANGGYCNVASDPSYIPHGCNRDWTTHLAALNKLPNVQTLGYLYTQYGARDTAEIEADIAEWAAWSNVSAPTWTAGTSANISVSGLWFDELGTDSGNYTQYAELVRYANATFATRKNADDRAYSVVLNAGPVADPAYEAQLFGLASAVVTKETCFTSDPEAAGVTADCPAPYAPFNYEVLRAGDGLPHNKAFLPQTVVIVHQFVGPPEATLATLQEQIEGVAALGIHSTYFTSGSWHQTTIAPATIGNVSELLGALFASEAGRAMAGSQPWLLWWSVPCLCALLHLQSFWSW